jgi:hypothetical protein
MNICKNCGVELEEHVQQCPLCGLSINESTIKSDQQRTNLIDEKLYSEYESLTSEQRRKLFWELSGIILFSGIVVTLIIDLITSRSVSWSKYCITVCLVLFVNTTLISFWRQRTVLVFAGSFVSTSVFLIVLDLFTQNIGWGIKLGIPLLFSFYLITVVLTCMIKYSRYPGLNVIANFLLAIGIFTICIEGIISFYMHNHVTLHWSLIVMVCMIPMASVLFFIQYKLKKGIDLKRFFHI